MKRYDLDHEEMTIADRIYMILFVLVLLAAFALFA